MTPAKLQKKSTTEPSITRLTSERELSELLHPDREAFIRDISEQSDRSQEIWRRFLDSHGHRETFLAAAYASHYGVLPEQFQTLARHLHLPKVEIFYDGEKYEKSAVKSFNFPSQLPKHLPLDPQGVRTIKTFECSFKIRPLRLCAIDMSDGLRGTPDVFSMHLSDPNMREVLHDLKKPVNQHALSAFAYLRYYVKDSSIEVSEIQNDFIERLSTRSLKERYKHWQELLVLAFEGAMAQSFKEHFTMIQTIADELRDVERDPNGPGLFGLASLLGIPLSVLQQLQKNVPPKGFTITLPVPSVVRERWSRSTEELDILRALARQQGRAPEAIHSSAFSGGLPAQIYGKVPETLGYHLQPSTEQLFVERSTNDTQISQMFNWQKEILHPPSATASATAEYVISTSLEETSDDFFASAMARFEEFFPPALYYQLAWEGLPAAFPVHRGRLQHSKLWRDLPGMVVAPIEPLTPESIEGLNTDMLASWRRHLSSDLVRPAVELLQNEYSFFSLGRSHGLPSDWWQLARDGHDDIFFQPMGVTDQKRHPSVRLHLARSSGQSTVPHVTIGAKGAGLTEHHRQDLWLPSDRVDTYLDIPIHKPAEIESGEIEVPSHKYWGGMILGHAQAEFRNSVGLVYLFESAGVNPLRRVAYPINVAQLHAVPRVQNGEVTWTPEFDYLFNMLEVLSHNRADQLGVFVSTSQSDVRLSQIVNRIFSRSEQSESDIIECRNEILSALRYLFEVNGRNFEDPQIPFVPNGASIGTRDYQLFVNKILEHNEVEGLRLYETLSRKLLSSLGLVHGAGGFLGGGYNGSGGAIGGGAVAIRNVDCCGVLHDLDLDVYLPWCAPGVRYTQRMIDEQQAMDRFFLKDTLYWLESLLVGREVPEGCSLQTVSVLSRFNKGAYFGTAPLTLTSVVDSLRADTPRQQQQRLFREPTETTELECRKIWCLTDQERSAYDKARSRGAQFGRAWKKPR